MVYIVEEDYKEEKTQSVFTIEVILILIIIAFMVLFNGRLGVIEADMTQSIFFGVFGLVMFAQMSWYEFKHRTRKVIINTGWSTFNGEFYINDASNHGLIELGSVRALGTELTRQHGVTEGTLIFALDEIQKVGKCVVLNVDYVKEIKLDEISDMLVATYILKEGIPPPYFITVNSSHKELRKPNTDKLLEILRNKSNENDSLEKKLKSKLDSAEKIVASGSRTRDIARPEIQDELEKLKKEVRNMR